MGKLLAYVGIGDGPNGGGIDVFEIAPDGSAITKIDGGVAPNPQYAGFLALADNKKVLYAVDERKDAGRNDKNPTCVYAYQIDKATGALKEINKKPTLGCSTSSVCVSPDERYIYTATHGKFDHVIKIVETTDGKFVNQFVYDDACVGMYPINEDGSLEDACDCFMLTGHGMDPCPSPQAGGHSQASPHAHIVVVDPSGKFVACCDKAAERVYIFKITDGQIVLASVFQAPLRVGPRHCAFDNNGHMFMTSEFSSEIWSFNFDSETGILSFADKQSTVEEGFTKRNELATVQITPDGKYVYVNNRGADTIVGYAIAADGTLTKVWTESVGKTPADPKDGIRDMQLLPDGKTLIVPVRPDNVLRAYAVGEDGSLTAGVECPASNPVFICLCQL
ncbi:MAG: lactonase family protein [Lachnospiraceae bacterium]|jgi:6-phosphogluconolactonase